MSSFGPVRKSLHALGTHDMQCGAGVGVKVCAQYLTNSPPPLPPSLPSSPPCRSDFGRRVMDSAARNDHLEMLQVHAEIVQAYMIILCVDMLAAYACMCV